MSGEVKNTRAVTLELDELDYDCLQAEVARYQATKRTADGVLLPDGESNLVGAVVCELIRDLLDYRDMCGADMKGLYDRWRLAHADWQAAKSERDELAAENARLESELAALRQIVADVETCRGVGWVDINADDADCPEYARAESIVWTTDQHRAFHAPTWQAALHAAAEWVRGRPRAIPRRQAIRDD